MGKFSCAIKLEILKWTQVDLAFVEPIWIMITQNVDSLWAEGTTGGADQYLTFPQLTWVWYKYYDVPVFGLHWLIPPLFLENAENLLWKEWNDIKNL